jgi:LysM repeat protein
MSKYLFLLILALISFKVKADINKYDSLRMEERNGQSFIVHKVEPKETLFSISRRYKVKVKDIFQHNEFVENGLKMYQELYVPINRISNQESDSTNRNSIYHVVKTKETMYFISKKYNLSIDELKQMNGLSDFNIDIGDSIIVGLLEQLLS